MKLSRFMCAWLVTCLVVTGTLAAWPHTEKPNVWVFRETANGRELIGASHNTIVNIGEQWHRNRFGFANGTDAATKYISLGNATVAATLTKLTTEATTAGFTRATGTVTDYGSGGDYGYNCTYTFTATATININAAGLHWVVTSDSDNNMFAANSLGSAYTFNTDDKCIIIWLVTCDDN